MSKNTILVNVLGQKTSALVDSGAAVTIISKQFFEKLHSMAQNCKRQISQM